jgi:hypothetical protein
LGYSYNINTKDKKMSRKKKKSTGWLSNTGNGKLNNKAYQTERGWCIKHLNGQEELISCSEPKKKRKWKKRKKSTEEKIMSTSITSPESLMLDDGTGKSI